MPLSTTAPERINWLIGELYLAAVQAFEDNPDLTVEQILEDVAHAMYSTRYTDFLDLLICWNDDADDKTLIWAEPQSRLSTEVGDFFPHTYLVTRQPLKDWNQLVPVLGVNQFGHGHTFFDIFEVREAITEEQYERLTDLMEQRDAKLGVTAGSN